MGHVCSLLLLLRVFGTCVVCGMGHVELLLLLVVQRSLPGLHVPFTSVWQYGSLGRGWVWWTTLGAAGTITVHVF